MILRQRHGPEHGLSSVRAQKKWEFVPYSEYKSGDHKVKKAEICFQLFFTTHNFAIIQRISTIPSFSDTSGQGAHGQRLRIR
jgi:hypothetical protein